MNNPSVTFAMLTCQPYRLGPLCPSGISPSYGEYPLHRGGERGRGDPSPTVDMVIGWLKYYLTKEINKMRGTTGEKAFQRSFYDHVVRNRYDYQEIYKYIYENPMKWQFDKLYLK